MASIASFCLVNGDERPTMTIRETIDAVNETEKILHDQVDIFGETVELHSDQCLQSILDDVKNYLEIYLDIHAVFTLNYECKIDKEEFFYMNITEENLIDAASIIAFHALIQTPNPDQMEILEGVFTSMKSRPGSVSTVIFLGERLKCNMEEGSKEQILSITKTLADAYLMIRDYEQALNNYQVALEMADQLTNGTGIKAKIHNNIGLCLKQSESNLQEAINMFTNSLISHAMFNDKTVETAITINNLASCYYELRKFDHAFNLFRRSLGVYCRLEPTQMIVEKSALVHKNIALCLMEKGDLKEALNHFDDFVKLFQENQDRLTWAKAFDSIGFCHSRLGHIKEALEAYKKAHQSRMVHYGGGKEAIGIYDDLTQVSVLSTKAKLNEDVSMGLFNIGNCYLRCGDHNRALEHFKYTLEFRKMHYGDKHFHVANTLYSIGLVYKTMGLLYMTEAHQHFEEALIICRQLEDDKGLANKIEHAMHKPTVRRGSIAQIVEQAVQKSIMRRQSLPFIGEDHQN